MASHATSLQDKMIVFGICSLVLVVSLALWIGKFYLQDSALRVCLVGYTKFYPFTRDANIQESHYVRTWYVSEIQGSLQFHRTSASFALCIFIHSFQDHLYKNKSDHFLRIDLAAYSIYSACVLGKLKSCSGWSLAAVISVVIYGTKSMDGYLLMFLYN